jgi:soluble lytic murein transglycosylase-like protein
MTKSKKPTKQEQARLRTRRSRIWIALAFIAALILVEFFARVDWPFSIRSNRQTIRNADAPLASFYTPEVLRWRDAIEGWADQYDLNPNVIAIIMQIESCGDPAVISPAGALGLMQVMPFHFENGENMLNPDTNVRRGMGHLFDCLEFGDWDMGRALACYNGGFVSPDNWAAETEAYYYWGTGLWDDVVKGHETSDTLDEWLGAGGQNLCARADQTRLPYSSGSAATPGRNSS